MDIVFLFMLKNNNFRMRIFKEFWVIILENLFPEYFWELASGLWRVALGQLWRADFGKNFGE